MRLNKWLYGAMALGMMTACSDQDVIQTPDDPNEVVTGQTASGYMAIEIKLPTEASTRADEGYPNDGVDFKDGTKEEYAVENAMILLFKGKQSDGEMKAKLYRARKLTKPFFTSQPTDDQITSSYLAAIDVAIDARGGDYIWALVILNNNDETTGVEGGEDTVGKTDSETPTTIAHIAGKTYTTNNTFRDVLLQTTPNSFRGSDGKTKFFMTNAPMSVVRGGYNATGLSNDNAYIQYLTPLGNQVYDTPDEAKTHISGCVYVERAVAKVTYDETKLTGTNKNILVKDAVKLQFVDEKGVELDMDNYEIEAKVDYALTNTNKTSFMVRNVEFGTDEKGTTLGEGVNHFSWGLSTKGKDGLNYARFVGDTPMPVLGAPFQNDEESKSETENYHEAIFRTYWCKDPNYHTPMKADTETGSGENKVTVPGDKVTSITFSAINQPLYCKENTFTVQNQNYGNSTLAVFKIDYTIYDATDVNNKKAVEDLFIKDGDYSKIYISKESAANDEITRICSDQGILDAMKKSLKTGHATTDYDVRSHLDIKIGRKDGDDDPTLVVKEIVLDVPTGGDAWFDANSVTTFAGLIGEATSETSYQYKLLENVNALNDITEFKGAVSYHVIPIMHFGDKYTPWNTAIDAGTAGSIKGTETKDVYNGGNAWAASDDHAKKYLGRYGMVRNNWYELSIEEVKALGSPKLPEITDNLANDNNEQKKYFAVEIHMLSWAKRTQGIKF